VLIIKMKNLIIISVALLVGGYGFGQKSFKIKSNVNRPIEIMVNGNVYAIDSTFQEIETNFPEFDSLFLSWEKGHRTKDPILCNFKPDSLYSIFHSCCATLDVYPTNEVENDSLNHWDFEADHSKIQKLMLDNPSITFRTNGEITDSIYAWYVDYSCMPQFKLINEKGWEYGSPDKCFYWSNISWFRFFKIQKDFSTFQNEKGIVEDIYPDQELSNTYELLGQIVVRLFDNDKYIIYYDVGEKKVSLHYEKLK
jgi:hypothetical protein